MSKGEYDDKETSEFQDTNRVFQRIDEAGVGAEECWIEINEGNYRRIPRFIVLVDVYFRQFKYICEPPDREEMEKKREELREWAARETRRIENVQVYSGGGVYLDDKLLETLRAYLEKAYELRHKYRLGSRTRRKIDAKKRARNAVRF
jgi:hypothetical protein